MSHLFQNFERSHRNILGKMNHAGISFPRTSNSEVYIKAVQKVFEQNLKGFQVNQDAITAILVEQLPAYIVRVSYGEQKIEFLANFEGVLFLDIDEAISFNGLSEAKRNVNDGSFMAISRLDIFKTTKGHWGKL